MRFHLKKKMPNDEAEKKKNYEIKSNFNPFIIQYNSTMFGFWVKGYSKKNEKLEKEETKTKSEQKLCICERFFFA